MDKTRSVWKWLLPVPADEAAGEVLKAAFGDTASYDGVSYRLEPGISRKKVLVPAITDTCQRTRRSEYRT